jgi:hypothetical protein
MMRNTLIEDKEVAIVCEESGHVNLNYNVLLTTPEVNTIIKPIGSTIIAKSTLTYINYGETNHSMETCHNRKREVPLVPIATIKSIQPIVGTKTQPIKSRKINVHYPCIICWHRTKI